MIKKIKQLAISLTALALLAVPVMVPASAFAANTLNTDLCEGIEQAFTTTPATGTCDTSGDNEIGRILRRVTEIFTMIVGAVSVIMIIYGGFRYITSGGDSAKVTTAKNTIMYALIGLIIVAVAQVIIRFVFREASQI